MPEHAGLHQEIFKKGSKTYFNSSLFFPPDVRQDVFVLYGFVRTADDFVDAVPQDAAGFSAFVDRYRRAAAGEETGDPVIDTFTELSRRKGFDDAWTEAFLASMEMDLTKRTHETIDETLHYIYGSAEVIGLYMAQILDLSPESHDAAMMLGRAMQFINFIRDIDEDNGFGRTYLPISETALPDLTWETTSRHPEEFRSFIRAQLERYRAWQSRAEAGFHYIPKRYLVPIKTASEMYNWTGRVIAANPFVVYRRKVKPSRPRILLEVLQNAVHSKERVLARG
jgi:phytoene synthase